MRVEVGKTVELGIVRASIQNIKLGEVRGEWAVFQIPVRQRGRSGSLEAVDNRPEVVKVASAIMAISQKIAEAHKERRSTDQLEAELRQKLFPQLSEVLRTTPAKVALQSRPLVGGRGSKLRLIYNPAPKGAQAEKILCVIRTEGAWHRDPVYSECPPVYWGKNREFALHIVLANNDNPVTIWELGQERVRAFYVTGEGWKMAEFQPKPTVKVEEEKVELAGEGELEEAEAPAINNSSTPTAPAGLTAEE